MKTSQTTTKYTIRALAGLLTGLMAFTALGEGKNAPEASDVAHPSEKTEVIEKMLEIGKVLLPLTPQMFISSQDGASLKSEKAEDDVVPEVQRLLRTGANPHSVKIVGFSLPEVERQGMFSTTSSGSRGFVVPADAQGDGISLLTFCESVKCWKLALIFMAYDGERNLAIMKADLQLAQLVDKAGKGDVTAQKNLAKMLSDGISPLYKDITAAIKYYEMAAAKNDPESQRILGNIFSKQGAVISPKSAIEWYKKAVDNRDAQALYELGVLYEIGWGVQEDMKRALELYTQSMELGCASAQNEIGYRLFNGGSMDKDIPHALALWEMASAQNNALAMCNLGGCYELGLGVTKDLEKARSWYRRAVECSTGKNKANAKKYLARLE